MSGKERLAGMQAWDRAQMRRDLHPRAVPLSVTAGGLISLSATTYAAIGSPPRVLLYLDRDTGQIAIRPVPGDVPNGFPVRLTRAHGARAVFNAKQFLVALGIDGSARALPITIEEGIVFAETREPPP